jgi:hypothetical protein
MKINRSNITKYLNNFDFETLFIEEKKFLQSLFFEGFGKREDQRSNKVKQLIGKIKYLNGGLFLPHTIEQKYQGKITIFMINVIF